MATLYTSYFLHCKTSVHAGDGTSTGTIDNPIQREKTTGFPVFRDSTLRGAIRESFESGEYLRKSENFIPAFGHKNKGDQASAIDIYPAKLLFFPVRSLEGVFAYVTCPLVLKRYLEDISEFHKKDFHFNVPTLEKGKALFADKLAINNKLGLEEFLFEKAEESNFEISKLQIDSVNRLSTHWAIIDDTSFSYFTRLFTEKVTRNKINIKTGVADDTGLFNVENLPEESILCTTIGFSNEFSKETDRKEAKEIQSYFKENLPKLIQLGGNKSIGKGLVQFILNNK